MTQENVWFTAYCAAISGGQRSVECERIANQAVSDFKAAFPEQMSDEPEFIKIPRKDKEGFELPEWVKPGEKCIYSGGKIKVIDFVGIDKDGCWCCHFIRVNGHEEVRWDYVKHIKPHNG